VSEDVRHITVKKFMTFFKFSMYKVSVK